MSSKNKTSEVIWWTVAGIVLLIYILFGSRLLRGCFPSIAKKLHCGASSAVQYDEDKVYYTLNDDKKSYSLTHVGNTLETVTVPATYKDKPVTGIAEKALTGSYEKALRLSTLTLPASIEKVAAGAVGGYATIEEVRFEGAMEEWLRIRFDCPLLSHSRAGVAKLYIADALVTSVTVPTSVTEISSYAFYKYSPLETLTLHEGITRIGSYAFAETGALHCAALPDSVTYLGERAFADCEFDTFVIGDGVTDIEKNGAFYGCSFRALTLGKNIKHVSANMEFSDTLESLTARGGVEIGEKTFRNFTALTDVTLADGSRIGESAFEGCAALARCELGAVRRIGKNAFYGCGVLSEIDLARADITILPDGAFAGTALPEAYIGARVTRIGDGVFENCKKLTSVRYAAVRKPTAGKRIFAGCSALEKVVFADGVTSVPDYLFADCTALTDVTFADGVTEIGDYAFHKCPLSSLALPSGVRAIGEYAFRDCTDSALTLPASVTKIAATAFHPSTLTSIAVDPANTVYYADGNCVVERASKTLVFGCRNSVIPSDISVIGENAFYNCLFGADKTLSIPVSVTEIRAGAFCQCGSLSLHFDDPEGWQAVETVTVGGDRTEEVYSPIGSETLGNDYQAFVFLRDHKVALKKTT